MLIKPWLTALKRKSISKPFKYIINNNLISNNHKILDYGCGYGYDVQELIQLNYNITGFDKYIEPFNDKNILNNSKFDIIVSNYMFNVIPSLEERRATLKNMLTLLNENGQIIITVRNIKEYNKINKSNIKEFNDGIVTSKNTFQKYFSEEELTSFIHKTINPKEIVTIRNSEYLMVKIQL